MGFQGQRADVLSYLVLRQSPRFSQSDSGGNWSGCRGMLQHRVALGTVWGCFSPAPRAVPQSLGKTHSCHLLSAVCVCSRFSREREEQGEGAGQEADAASGVEEQGYWAAPGGTGCVRGVAQNKHRAGAGDAASGSVGNYSCVAQCQVHFDLVCHMVLAYCYGLHGSPIISCKVILGQQRVIKWLIPVEATVQNSYFKKVHRPCYGFRTAL